MLAQGIPFKVVSDIPGPSQIGTTADLYTHVLPSLRKEAIDLMSSLLLGTKKCGLLQLLLQTNPKTSKVTVEVGLFY